jgi:hypothetical protein
MFERLSREIRRFERGLEIEELIFQMLDLSLLLAQLSRKLFFKRLPIQVRMFQRGS